MIYIIIRVLTIDCKSTCHRWQVPPGGAAVVSGGENTARCNLPPTKSDLPLTNNGCNGGYYQWQLYNRHVWTAVGVKALLCFCCCHFILYCIAMITQKLPLLHRPDFLLGLSECPHFLRTCSTVLLWRVWYLQTHQGSEHNMLFLMNSPKIFSPRHPWFHPAKGVFVPRDTQNRCTEGR